MNLIELRCLTVLQPFAHLIADGTKTVELRPWRTSYRGLVAVCAGARDIVHAVAWALVPQRDHALVARGRAVSLVRLVDVREATEDDSERAVFSVAQYRREYQRRPELPVYAFILERVCPLDFPVRGRQRLFRPSDGLLMHASEKYLAHALANHLSSDELAAELAP